VREAAGVAMTWRRAVDNILCHFEIPAEDVASLAEFYRQLFAWSIEPMPGGEGYLSIRTGPEPAVGGGMMARQHPGQQIINYILVQDVAAHLEKAQGLGAQVLVPQTEIPGIGWFGVIMDPQGNCLGLFRPLECSQV
jgi:uncharacterized protein